MLSKSELCGCVEVDRLGDLDGRFFGNGNGEQRNEEFRGFDLFSASWVVAMRSWTGGLSPHPSYQIRFLRMRWNGASGKQPWLPALSSNRRCG